MDLLPHIHLPRDLGVRYAILPGDPARAQRIAEHLTQVKDYGMNREYRALTGFYKGVEVLALSTGMGGPSTAIALEELCQMGVTAAIRVGSCGTLQPNLALGSLILVTGAVRDEGTSKGYAPIEYPAVPDFQLLAAVRASAQALGVPHTLGLARSHDCLYGEENLDAVAKWGPKRVFGSDQETAALFVCGMVRGIRTASILNVVARCDGDVAADVGSYASGAAATAAGEKAEILTALEAFYRIHQQEGV